MKRSLKSGFTLAEVLITLAVIGVVAAMSIPALIGSTNQQEYKVALKKAVAVVNQAITMSIALDSTNAAQCASCLNGPAATPSGNVALANYFRNRLNVIGNGPFTDGASFYTADGMMFHFLKNTATACNTPITGTTDALAAATSCAVMVDVNGAKGPNLPSIGSKALGTQVYKDQYYVVIRDESSLPSGNATLTIAQDAMTY